MIKEITIFATNNNGDIIEKQNGIDYIDLISTVTIFFQKYIKNADQKKIDKFIDELIVVGNTKFISENNRATVFATGIKT